MTGLTPELRDALEALARAGHLLVALDFDGTLAPFVDDPAQARPLPAAARALRELVVTEDTDVALVSGRSLASLRDVAEPDARVLLVGSHGAERYAPPELGAEHDAPSLDAAQRKALSDAADTLARIADGAEGAWVEHKPAGAVLHTRRSEAGMALERAATRALEDLGGELTITPGKDVVEVSVLPADKGQGLSWARDLTDASVVLFAGDDRTDEDAFAVLGPKDIGVKVGPGRSAARFRVDGPGDIGELLELVVDVRG